MIPAAVLDNQTTNTKATTFLHLSSNIKARIRNVFMLIPVTNTPLKTVDVVLTKMEKSQVDRLHVKQENTFQSAKTIRKFSRNVVMDVDILNGRMNFRFKGIASLLTVSKTKSSIAVHFPVQILFFR